MQRGRIRTVALMTCAALLVPAAPALAGRYAPPSDPGKTVTRPGGKQLTLRVCPKRGRQPKRCYETIQAAVNAAAPGETIRVPDGTYREAVKVLGKAKRGIRLIGNRRRPAKVLVDVQRLPSSRKQNAILINGANGVEVNGFKVLNYAGNGVFALNVDGYKLTNLVAGGPVGAYGLYAFNSKGGEISSSEAYYNSDSGFYIGQTPPQSKPKRSTVKNIRSWGNVLGWSGTNMRYVTIRGSRFYNNGVGVVPNALASEKYAPAEDNVITDNDVFWNNFDYYAGSPFKLEAEAEGLANYPIGTGILLFGGQRQRIEGNRVYGNWAVGIGAVQQFRLGDDVAELRKQAEKATGERKQRLLDQAKQLEEAAVLRNNEVSGNVLGKGGRDLNASDLFYDGSGTGNCFADNRTLSPNVPADNSTFAPCPGPAQNTLNPGALAEAFRFLLPDLESRAAKAAFVESTWVRHPHEPQPGIAPLIRYTR